ncbi:MAG TPA: hypothetical protein VLL52_21620 [Anaerolineae bacterium]|nr:hypothetical protein [Anaerolineae bacterium]
MAVDEVGGGGGGLKNLARILGIFCCWRGEEVWWEGWEGREAEGRVWYLVDDGGRGIVREKFGRGRVCLGAQCRVITDGWQLGKIVWLS